MAGQGVIGKLTLDISDINKKVEAINNALGKIGKDSKVKFEIADEVKKQIDKVYKELEQGADKITKSVEKVTKGFESASKKNIDTKNLKDYIAVYKEFYQMQEKAMKADARGDHSQAEYFRQQADAARELIEVMKIENDELRKQAEASNAASSARAKLYDADQKLASKEIADALKEETAAIKEKAQAEKEASSQAAAAQKKQDTAIIQQAKQAYFELTDAIKNYTAAKKEGDAQGMAQYQGQIDAQMQVVAGIEQSVQASNMEAGAKQQVLNIIQQCYTAQHQQVAATTETARASSELESQMTGMLTRMFSIMAAYRTISSILQNMIEYVTEYSDKMNEIQIITQGTDQEAERLGKTYRNIAEQMNVSSLELADAAVYFTRQGLAASEIEERLQNVTMYAKTANVEFRDASEIITAVVNSMNLVEQAAEDGRNATQRVADVFLAVGDSAATSGQEIGEAMQKAAASAGAMGFVMAWLLALAGLPEVKPVDEEKANG